jgi:hypothetical protein
MSYIIAEFTFYLKRTDKIQNQIIEIPWFGVMLNFKEFSNKPCF